MGNAAAVVPAYDMKGKVVVVTGSNTGIGKETARFLSQHGAHVIMACRSADRAKAAMEDISQKVPEAKLDFIPLDLANWETIKSFITQLRQNHNHIDVLINNAGVVKSNYEKSNHGVEFMLTVNYLGTLLLTEGLLEDLEKAPNENGPPRIVFVGSNSHSFPGKLDLKHLNWNEEKNGKELSVSESMTYYGRSKLCGLLYFFSLNKKLREKNSNILVYAADPGWVQTELSRAGDEKFYIGMVKTIEELVAKKPEAGCIPTLFCACSADLSSVELSGQYFAGPNKAAPLKSYAKDPDSAAALLQHN